MRGKIKEKYGGGTCYWKIDLELPEPLFWIWLTVRYDKWQ